MWDKIISEWRIIKGFIMVNRLIHEVDITILYTYVWKHGALKYIKPKLIALKGKINP